MWESEERIKEPVVSQSENESKFKEGEIVQLLLTQQMVQIVGEPRFENGRNSLSSYDRHGWVYPCRYFHTLTFNNKNFDFCQIKYFIEYELEKITE